MTQEKSSEQNSILNSTSSFFDVTYNEVSHNDQSPTMFSSLSEENQKNALYLASTINIAQYESILQFGVEAQHNLKHFTNNLLIQVQRNDTSPIREVLFKLMEQLEKIDPDSLVENKGFFSKLFNRAKSTIQEQISHFKRLSVQIDRLSIQLLHAQKGLLSDINMLEELYRLNEEYYHNINIYIAAAQLKVQDMLTNHLPKLQTEAVEKNDLITKQKLNDFLQAIEWLDKRIYDLQLSREIAIQSAPQIRLIQQTNRLLVEKIQSSVLTTIPLWQTQISMLVNINNQRRINMAGQRLMDVSDDMIRKNAKMIEVSAKESKRHKTITHTDIDIFKKTQLQLIESIEDTLRVQAESNVQQAEIEAKVELLSNKK
ncbi:MAG TPA: toxic anion resistance protein [Ureibacillus sp.]|nr:toxic anion resistance protein [Ureibacillus sp.]